MNKLNNKGFGHHLLLIAVTTLAVLGAAGFFVWNRQKDNGIAAKAAGYDYQYVATQGMGAKYGIPEATFEACSFSVPSTKSYVVNTRLTSNKKAATGTIKVGNTVVQTLRVATTGSIFGQKTFSGTTKLTFGGTWTNSIAGIVKPFVSQSFAAQDLIPCDKRVQSANYNYALYATDTKSSTRNIELYACKIPYGNNQYLIDTKFYSAIGYPTNISVEEYNPTNIPSYTYKTGFDTDGQNLYLLSGWPRPVVSASPTTSLAIRGTYLKLDGTEQSIGQSSPVPIDSVPTCYTSL